MHCIDKRQVVEESVVLCGSSCLLILVFCAPIASTTGLGTAHSQQQFELIIM